MNQDDSTHALVALCTASRGRPDHVLLQRLVQRGADVFATVALPESDLEGSFDGPLLTCLIDAAQVVSVQTCLATERAMDFCVCDDVRDTPLHKACYGHLSDEDTAALLRAIVHRLETHPTDKVDWMLQNAKHQSMLQLAALHQKLSTVWPIVCNAPALGDAVEPMPLPVVWRWDWEALPAEEQQCFCCSTGAIVEADEPTGKLWSAVKYRRLPNVDTLRQYVMAGANLNFACASREPLLLTIEKQWSSAYTVAVLDVSTCALDFTLTDQFFGGENFLLLAAGKWKTQSSDAEDIWTAFAQRLSRRAGGHPPLDRVDWSAVNGNGETVFAVASKFQGLSALCRTLKPIWGTTVLTSSTKFSLREVWEWDWNALSVEDREHFDVLSKMIAADVHTARLAQYVDYDGEHVKVVQAYVDAGANILFKRNEAEETLLWKVVQRYPPAFTAAVLSTSHSIDFTVMVSSEDQDGDTLLHSLCYARHHPEVKLHHLIHRLKSHPEDVVNWNQRNHTGVTFISMVAWTGVLALFWPVLRSEVDFFARNHHHYPIELSKGIVPSDWAQLAPEDQQLFMVGHE